MKFDPRTPQGGIVVTASVAAFVYFFIVKPSHDPEVWRASSELLGVGLVSYWLLLWRLSQQEPEQPGHRIAPPTSIRCFRCKADIATPPELLGKKTKCPKCGIKNQLPG